MGVIRYKVSFDSLVPSIAAIATRFGELTGLDLAIEQLSANSFTLSSWALKGEVELAIDSAVWMTVFRINTGYLEWALLRTLRTLGGGGYQQLPRFAEVPWAELSWFQRWRHG